jgi:transposase-like protein
MFYDEVIVIVTAFEGNCKCDTLILKKYTSKKLIEAIQEHQKQKRVGY